MKVFNPRQLSFALTTFATFGLATSGTAAAATFRTLDGTGNNPANPSYGAADTQLLRLLPSDYGDGSSAPAGSERPSPRAISNAVANQSSSVTNSLNASDWLWQWGQFIDHDLDLTEPHQPLEPFNIPVPTGDPYFDPMGTGTQVISLNRSIYDPATGTSPSNPRQQLNQITAFIDASNVYGSDAVRANFLRTFEGGKLKTSAGELLPFNTAGLPNANPLGVADDSLFLAGDVRANEQIGLTAVHTLFVREHNRLAEAMAADPETPTKAAEAGLSVDEYIYQAVRKIVGAQMQAITHNEFLPVLLGDGALEDYSGYDETVNLGISNEFATAAFRVGHTMLSPELQRVNNNGSSLGSIPLRDAFFTAEPILDEGIDSLLLGLASQKAQAVDTLIVDDVRNFLFGPPGAGGFDLASLNIQRGREHGLPSYNQARIGLGLGGYSRFAEITSDVSVQNTLASVYDSVDEIDLWVGGLAEEHVNGGIVGELFHTIIADQFSRTRDGDRFFYLHDEHLLSLAPDIEQTTLSEIIRRNTSITNIQDDVFRVSTSVPEPSALFSLLGFGILGASSQLWRKMK